MSLPSQPLHPNARPAEVGPADADPALAADPTTALPGPPPSPQVALEDLVDVPRGCWDHLQDAIARLTSEVQNALASRNLSEQAGQARLDRQQYGLFAPTVDSFALTVANELGVLPQRERDRRYLLASVRDEIIGFGPIDAVMRHPGITDVMINGPRVFIKRSGVGRHEELPGCRFRHLSHLENWCRTLLGACGRSIGDADPIADGWLPDGSRVHAEVAPAAVGGPYVAIRRFPSASWTLSMLVDNHTMSRDLAVDLARWVRVRANVIVAGGVGAGKTTLLNALVGVLDPDERVYVIEDTSELQFPAHCHVLRHVTQGSAKQAREGRGVSYGDLARASLRSNYDRLIFGELRGEYALYLLNSNMRGHPGGLSTVHAETADYLLTEVLPDLIRDDPTTAHRSDGSLLRKIANGVDIAVILAQQRADPRRSKHPARSRHRVVEVVEVHPPHPGSDERHIFTPMWQWTTTGLDQHGLPDGSWDQVGRWSAELRRLRGFDHHWHPDWDDLISLEQESARMKGLTW